jgi:GNAT superfamily N-acetyltransferase
MTITVRPLVPTDRAAWLPLWQSYIDFYGRVVTPEISDLTWLRLHDAHEPMFGLGAVRDGMLAGFAIALLHRSTWLKGYSCYLEDLFVAPEARGGGAGRALIEAVAAEAVGRGADRLHWLTHRDNATARRLYDALASHSGMVSYRRSLLPT